MASSSYCNFFSSPMARFMEDCERELSPETDEEFDQLLSTLLLDVLSDSAPPTALPTSMLIHPGPSSTSSTLILSNANAEHLQCLKNKNKNTDRSTSTWTSLVAVENRKRCLSVCELSATMWTWFSHAELIWLAEERWWYWLWAWITENHDSSFRLKFPEEELWIILNRQGQRICRVK